MTKQEYINILKFEIEQKKGTPFDGILMAYEGMLELAEQLDEPKECEILEVNDGDDEHPHESLHCTNCRVCYDYLPNPIYFCPYCGAKIIKSEGKV